MLRKIMSFPPLDWRTSGLFNNAEIGLDDLLSPGVSNCFENSGSWLLESNFNKYGTSISSKNEEDFRDKDVYPAVNLRKETSITPTSSDQSGSSIPMTSLKEFELNDGNDDSISHLIIFPSLSPPVVDDIPSPTVFEDLLHLEGLADAVASRDQKYKKVCYLSESVLKTAKSFPRKVEASGVVAEGRTLNPLEFLKDIVPIMSTVPHGITSKVEDGFIDTTALTFLNHFLLENVEEEQVNLMEPTPFCGLDLNSEDRIDLMSAVERDGKSGNESSLSLSSSLSTLDLTAIDLKLLEEIMGGSEKKNLVLGVCGINDEPEVEKTSDSKIKVQVGRPTRKETEDESMEDEEEEEVMDESRKKYLERRKKNNIASRRSREIRKVKYSEMEKKAKVLESENKKLKEKIARMEKLTARMKETLIERLRRS